tara:strand:- start:897 stop:1859 length:963 start_codon:yes stop_codon:yes gene_type:complete
MAQADGNVANGSGSAVRSDINTQLAAVFTNHSGGTAPSTTFAYQFWVDTTAGELKIRNGANSAWISLRSITSGGIVFPAGGEAAPSVTFGTDGPDYGFYRSSLGAVAYVTQFSGADHTLFSIGKDNGTDADGVADGPSLYWGMQTNPTASNNTTNEGLIISKRGRIRVTCNNSFSGVFNRVGSGGTQLGSVVEFRSNGTQAGRIGIISATDVSLIDASDRRLKDNITDMPEAKSRINQIQMHRFRMISTETYEEGFIAQELQAVVPSAVMGMEDSVDENGNVEYMGVGKDMLVPLLMKGLQEAFAEIAALTARVETLEAG